MHDPRVPSSTPKLIAELSSFISIVQPSVRWTLLQGFWETIAREWSGIDRARLDKYLSLVRVMLREEFAEINGGGEEMVEHHVAILGEWPLNADLRRVPDGLRYQVLDCWEDELVASGLIVDDVHGQDAAPEKRVEAIRKLMGLVQELGRNAVSKGVKTRVKEVLEEGRLRSYAQRK